MARTAKLKLTDKIEKLMALCPGKFWIEFNPHQTYGESVSDYLKNCNIDAETLALITDKGIIYRVEAHPESVKIKDGEPNSALVYHWDLETAIDEALKAIE